MPPPGPGHARIAVAAPHGAAVDAAREIVDAGGNAVDAAVAAAAALVVVYPHMCSLGGDAIGLLRRRDGSLACVNASGAYGSGPDGSRRLAALTEMPGTGPLTVSVPGVVSGWAALLELGGSLPVEILLAPAIRLARSGFPVSPNLAHALALDRIALALDAGLRETFFTGSGPLGVGELLTQGPLADTLDSLARDGLDAFYRGPLARRLADGLNRLSVPVTAEDLAGHHPSVEAPLVADFPPYTIATAGPNSQGYTLFHTLGALFSGAGPTDAGLLAELFYDAGAHRDTHLADPRHAALDVTAALTPPGYRRTYERAAGRLATAPPSSPARARPTGDTVGVAVVSADGTAVSLIQSVFFSFGAQLLEPDTGLVLHNRAASFVLDPTSPNRVAAGKRPAHTLVPVIVEYRDGAVAAHATMGGRAQTQIHAQLLLRAETGMSAQETVAAPRFVVGALQPGETDRHVMVEPALEPAAVDRIRRTSLTIRAGRHLDDDAGHAMIARIDADGSLDAGADPRSDGGVFIGA